jgi:hypothetical protein
MLGALLANSGLTFLKANYIGILRMNDIGQALPSNFRIEIIKPNIVRDNFQGASILKIELVFTLT